MKQGIKQLLPILFFSMILLPLLTVQDIVAQEKKEKDTKVDSTAAPILPFDLSEISLESNKSITRANKLGSERLKEEEFEIFKSEVDSILIPIDTFLIDTIYQNLGRFTNWDLEKTINRVNLYTGQLTLKEGVLNRRYKGLESNFQELSKLKERWQITVEAVEGSEIQETLLGRIDMALGALDSVNTLIRKDMAELLLLTDRLLNRQSRLENMKTSAHDALLALSQNMFKKDNRVYFKDLYQFRDSTLFSAHFQSARKSFDGDVQIFRSEFPHVPRTIIILLIILTGFTFWFSRNYKSVISQNKINIKETQRYLIQSPLLTGIFSTFIIIHFAYPELPFTFSVINLLILSAPIAVLAIRFKGKGVSYWVIWAIASYALSLIYRLTFAPDVLQRTFMLLLSLAGLGLYGWMLSHPESKRLLSGEVGHRLERGMVVIFVVMMVAAIVANFAGFFSLATFLTLVPFQLSFLLVAVKVLVYFTGLIFYLLLGSKISLRLNVISDFNFDIYRWIKKAINVFFFIFFFLNALGILRVRDVFLEWGGELLTNKKEIGEASISLESILIFVFVIWLSVFITKIVRYVLEKDVFVRVTTSKGVPGTIVMMVRIILISAGFFLAAAAAGMELNNLSIIIGAFSVGIGFGLQNIFNNMVSGLILAFERPINVGDVVQVGELMGTVTTLGLRASKVKSFDGAEVIVPNGNLISDQLINWTLSDAHRRMDIRVGVAYGTDPSVVLEIIREAASGHQKVRKQPPPTSYFIGFGDSSLDFRLLAWVDIDSRLSVESELHVTINDRIKEAGIEIPFPQRDLHIRSDDTKAIQDSNTTAHTPAQPAEKPATEPDSKDKPGADSK